MSASKFNLVPLKRADKVRLMNLITQVGLVPTEGFLHAGLVRVWTPKRLPATANTVKQLITSFESQLYFRCIPKTKQGERERRRFDKFGYLDPNVLLTRSAILAAHMNKHSMLRVINSRAFIVGAKVKETKPVTLRESVYDTLGKRCLTMFTFELQLTKSKSQALEITRKESLFLQ